MGRRPRPCVGNSMLDREIFFQRQAEECRELARHSANEDDRTFWQQTAERWEEQIRKFKQVPKQKMSAKIAASVRPAAS